MLFPSKCPHCGKDIVENVVCKTLENVTGIAPGVCAEAHKCIHCNRYIFAFRGFLKREKDFITDPKSIICYYPVTNYVDYPDHVKNLSPAAYSIYKQTCNARDYGLASLLGAGLRMALERLIWDYLIKIQNISESDLEGKTLGKLIPMLEGKIKGNLYIKVLKYFGNKSIHVTTAENFSLEEAFNVYNALLEELEIVLRNIKLEEKLKKLNS